MKMINVLLGLLVLCQPALAEEIDKAKWIELLNGGNTSLEKMHGKEFTVTGKLKIQGDRKKCVKALLLVDVFDGKKTQNISIPVDFGMPIFLTPDDIREARLNVKFNTVKVEDERLADDYDPPEHLKKTPVGFKVRSLGGGVTKTTTVFADDPALDKKQLEDARAKGKLVRILNYGMFVSTATLVKKNDPEPNVAKAENNETTRPSPIQKAWSDRVVSPVEYSNSIGMKFVIIPPGEFTMGSPNAESGRTADEIQHRVKLTKPFYLGVYEVTQDHYQQVMDSNPSGAKGSNFPVERVTWTEATAFCQRLTDLPTEKVSGRAYRLPTEAEWEYACRAATTTAYSFGDDEAKLGDFAWYAKNSNRSSHEVGLKKPNPWGLFDMHGNVWEWCADLYGDYPRDLATDPTGSKAGTARVLRGGPWMDDAANARSARRGGYDPTFRAPYFGFRVVLAHELR